MRAVVSNGSGSASLFDLIERPPIYEETSATWQTGDELRAIHRRSQQRKRGTRMGSGWINCPKGVTMQHVAYVRRYVEDLLGIQTDLVIQRSGERNTVSLQFVLPDGLMSVDVKTVFQMMRNRKSPKDEQMRSLREAMRVA